MVCHRMGDNQPSQNQFRNFQKLSPVTFGIYKISIQFQEFQNFQNSQFQNYVLEKSRPLGLGILEFLESLEILAILEILGLLEILELKKFSTIQNFQKVRPYVLKKSRPLDLRILEFLEILEILDFFWKFGILGIDFQEG